MTSAFDRLPRRPLVAVLAAVAAAGVLAACSSGSSGYGAAGGTGNGQQAAASGITVSARTVAGVGTVLTGQSGKTLYSPQQEAGGVIKCTASCLSFWFPVTVGKGAAPRAASSVTGTLGTIQRPDGGSQLTYDGKPLYTFRLDTGPGQLHGNNYSDQFGSQSFTWHAITASGGAATSGQPSSAPSYSYQGGNPGY
jgi:predicted lipoprotein with Yx(FWY)xxD motif